MATALATNRQKVEALSDARFCRMWDFYLAGCFQLPYITDFERANASRVIAA